MAFGRTPHKKMMQGDSAEDEPTTYLDIRYQIEILQLVKKLNQEFGITIIMVLYGIELGVTRVDGQKFVLAV